MPKHGTSSNYTHGGCRCQPCKTAHATYDRHRRQSAAAGNWEGLVEPTAAREHLEALYAAGMTKRQIIDRSGVNEHTLRVLRLGKLRTIQAATARAILGTKPEPRAYGTHVDATATRRRLQSLQFAGWTYPLIRDRSGISIDTLGELTRGVRTSVLPATRDAITATSRALDLKTAPDTRRSRLVRKEATRKGWVDLAAWDDVDDPNEKPKGIPSQEAPQGPPRVEADVIATIHRLHRAGHNDRSIAIQLGYATPSAIQKLRHRHPEEDAA